MWISVPCWLHAGWIIFAYKHPRANAQTLISRLCARAAAPRPPVSSACLFAYLADPSPGRLKLHKQRARDKPKIASSADWILKLTATPTSSPEMTRLPRLRRFSCLFCFHFYLRVIWFEIRRSSKSAIQYIFYAVSLLPRKTSLIRILIQFRDVGNLLNWCFTEDQLI